MSSTYVVSDGIAGTLTIFCAAGTGTTLSPIVPGSTPTDGTNVMTTLFNLRTGGGSEWNLGVGLRASGAGGSVEAGTATSPLRTDPTGTTPQPASQSGTWTVGIAAGSAVIGHVIVDSGTVAATQSGSWTVSVSGTVTVTGTVTLGAGSAVIGHVIVDSGTVAATQSGTWTVALAAGSAVIGHVILDTSSAVIGHVIVDSGAIVVTNGGTFAVQAAQSGTWNIATVTTVTTVATVTSLSQWAGQAIDLGSGTTGAGTLRVVLPTDQTAIPAAQSGTWTVTLAAGSVVIGHVIVDSATLAQLPTALTDAGNLKVALKESTAPIAVTPAGPFTVQTAANAPLLMAGSDYAWRSPAARTWKVDALGIGQVTVASALPPGTNPIGSVTLGAGTAAIGSVTVSAGTLAQLPPALSQFGNLKVALAEATAPVSVTAAAPLTVQTAPSNPLLLAGSDYAWRMPAVRALKVDALGTAQVNVVSLAGITPSFGSGATDAGTRRVVIASDQATLKVDGSAVTQPVTGAVTVTNPAPLATKEAGPVTVLTGVNAPLVMGGSDYAWRTPAARPLRVDALGAAHVVLDGGTLASIAPFNNRTATATLASLDSVEVPTAGCGTALLALTGSAVNIGITIEGTADGVNWIGADAYDSNKGPAARAFYPGGNEITITSFAAANYVIPCAGFMKVRARVSTYTSGAATFSWSAGAFERAVISHSTACVSMVANGRTTAPTQGLLVMGQTSDFTAQYRPLPLSAAGATVLVATGTDPFTVTTVATVTTITNAVTVVGAAASGATKSGNPVQMGAVFNTTQPTVTTGQAVELQTTARGAIIVATGVDTFTVDTELPAAAALADGAAATPTTPTIGVIPLLYNGSTMDRRRAVQQIQLFNLSARATAAAQVSSIITNHNSRGLVISVNVTAMTAGKTLLLNVLGRNVTDAFNWRLCDDLTITAAGVWVVEISPGASGTTGTVNDIVKTKSGGLPRAFFIILTASDGTSWTYSAYADLLL